jgi:hypothetical protein
MAEPTAYQPTAYQPTAYQPIAYQPTAYQQAVALVERIRRYDPGAPAAVRAAGAAGLVRGAGAGGLLGPDRFVGDVADAAHLAGWAEAAIACPAGGDMVGCGSVMADPDVLVCEWRRGDRDGSNESAYHDANWRGYLWRWMRQHDQLIGRDDGELADQLVGMLVGLSASDRRAAAGRLAAVGRAFRRLGIDAGAFYSSSYWCQTDHSSRTYVASAARLQMLDLRAPAELRPGHEHGAAMYCWGPPPGTTSAEMAKYRLGRGRSAARTALRVWRHGLQSPQLLYEIAAEEPGWIRAAARARPSAAGAEAAIARTASADVVRVLARGPIPPRVAVPDGRSALLRMAAAAPSADGRGSLRAAFAPSSPPVLEPRVHWEDADMVRALGQITALPAGRWPFGDHAELRRIQQQCVEMAKIVAEHWTDRTTAFGDPGERRQALLEIARRFGAALPDTAPAGPATG